MSKKNYSNNIEMKKKQKSRK